MTDTNPNSSSTTANHSPLSLSRRQFLSRLSIALGGIGAALVGAPVVGFILAPLARAPSDVWRAVGDLSDFSIGTTSEVTFLDASPLPWSGVAAKTAAWLRRESETQFVAFAANCTHLGCPVRWLAGAKLFMCPCHGGVFYKDGSVASGPPPKPLARYHVRVRDGKVEILASPIPFKNSAS
jgi:quinol---cytochrome c reductase iron-sulfur subunit, bacillus type